MGTQKLRYALNNTQTYLSGPTQTKYCGERGKHTDSYRYVAALTVLSLMPSQPSVGCVFGKLAAKFEPKNVFKIV